MITQEKLRIYKKYDGSIDGWARSGRKKERNLMSDDDFSMIERLIQDLKLIDKGLAAEVYINDFYKRLNDNCDNAETIEQIKAMLDDTKNSPEAPSFVSKILGLFGR